MKEEFIDLSADMKIENGILLSYEGMSRVVVVPASVNRIGINAFLNKNIESVLLPEGLESIESGAFRGCHSLKSVKIPHGVVQIADSAFAYCSSLKYVIIPESVLIIGNGVFSSHSEGLVVVAKRDSYAYKYATEKKLTVCEDERELDELIKRVNEGANSLTYREVEIYGERLRVSSTLPICDEIFEHYKEVEGIISTRIFARQHIANADFITDVLTDFILSAANRACERGALTNGTEMLKLVGPSASTLREGFFVYQKTLLDVTKYEIDKKQARVRFDTLISDFTDALASAEIECLARHSIIHADAAAGLDKKKAMEIAARIMESDGCAEVSLALSLRLYPYNPALIRYAIRCGKLCDGLIDLIGILNINLFGEYIYALVDRRDLFGITDIRAFVRGEFDKIISDSTWAKFTERGVSPAPFAQLDLRACINREDAVERVTAVLEGRKAELDRLYRNAVSLYAEARGKKRLSEAVLAFKRLEGYGDSKAKIAEIEAKIKRRKMLRATAVIGGVIMSIAVAIGVAILFLMGSIRPVFEERGGYYAVVGYRGYGESCEIPSEHNGKPVTVITAGAFSYCKSLERVELPNGLISIGNEAFKGCIELEDINIPDSVTTIGSLAFADCIKLERIAIPSGVKRIESGTFRYCEELEQVTIFGGVEYIGDSAFSSCLSLEQIAIPNTTSYIGNYAFASCTSLEDITFVGVAAYGIDPFKLCPVRRVTIDASSIPAIPKNALKSVIITGGAEILGESFKDCTTLESLVLPTSIRAIGPDAFLGCSALNYIAFDGTETEWSFVALENGNEPLIGKIQFLREDEI